MVNNFSGFYIIGAGCWGSTLANVYSKKNIKIVLCEPNRERYNFIKEHRHPKFFNYVKLPKNVEITTQFKGIENFNIVFLVVTSIYVRKILLKLKALISNWEDKIFISCVKGIDFKTFSLPSKLISEILSIPEDKIFVFSGPSHAEEIALGKPAAITLAGKNKQLLPVLQKLLSTSTIRVYTDDDVIGVEIAGAVKNIYAIAAGICDGLHLGNNAKSALITRSLKEMVIIGKLFGSKTRTFFGLSGIGDLLTTCYSPYSRNRTFGEYLAKYHNVAKAKQKIHTSIEGLYTVKSVYKLIKKHNLELPIAEEVYKIVYKNKNPESSIKTLLSRPLKQEFDWW